MKIKFTINYYTTWGEELRTVVSLEGKAGERVDKEFLLTTDDGHTWKAEVEIGTNGVARFTYVYKVFREGLCVRNEWNASPRYFDVDANKTFVMNDHWRDIPMMSHLFSSAFTECINRRKGDGTVVDYYMRTLMMRVMAPQLKPSEALAIVGSVAQLGAWDVGKAVRMKLVGACQWAVSLNASQLTTPMEYKYVVVDRKTGSIVRWECGFNRIVNSIDDDKQMVTVVDDDTANFDTPAWKGAGIVLPVFSLRSEKSQGVGDFGDLKRLVDWVISVKMAAIQILPINDTTITNTWMDSYPYNSISIYALHPMYADLGQLPKLKNKQKQARFEKEFKRLNALDKIDYEAVNAAKRGFLHDIFAQEGEKELESDAFKEFFRDNNDWLVPYAAYSHLRDKYGVADFHEWPEHNRFNREQIEQMCRKEGADYQDIAFYYYVQFVLHTQLTATSQYAREKGVIIKGDIPIGISRSGVETWTEPHYFNLNGQAGAPPDAFSANGQNWGFPTYNWDVMQRDGCQWWMRRFGKMSEYFDAYRIDHILGFFRIWEIPVHSVHGLLGQFSPALPMSQGEIESYGLHFDRDFMTRPYITDWILDRVFGERAAEVKTKYLQRRRLDMYDMLPEYDTQRKVEAAFAGVSDETELWLRDGLYSLISNVLFIIDRQNAEMYHPRISAQLDFTYEVMSDSDKEAFNRLYNDYFYRRHNQFWYEQAMKKLPALTSATRMLVCGEDLGMVPDSVPWVMNELHILSLEIQSMPKNPDYAFGRLWENPYLSVSTISTHDMQTFRGWWEEDWQRRQRYFNEVLCRGGEAPEKAPGWLCEEVVSNHLRSHSMLCLLSFQDWISMSEELRFGDVMAERINFPANPRYYWRYRMHISIEELKRQTAFNNQVRSLIENSGRA